MIIYIGIKKWAGLSLMLMSLMCGGVFGATCSEFRDYLQNLPAAIGNADQVGKFPYALKCDTVFVRKGQTTVIYPGTLLYFANPTLNSVIKVEGTLLIQGNKETYTSLSGSLDTTSNGIEAGNKQWGGIEVAEGGTLEIAYGGFMRAPTPITTFSRQVKIVNSWFKGSSGIILPDGSVYPMESKWHAINDLDLSKGIGVHNDNSVSPDALSQKEKADLLKKPPTSFLTWKKLAGGAAVVAVLGVGATLISPKDKPKASPKPDPDPTPTSTLKPFILEFPVDSPL